MAFYSPNWVRKLLKEDASNIVEYVKVKKNNKYVNDFRGYIDATLPFTLWLDIKEIRDKVIDTTSTTTLIKSALSNIFKEPELSAKINDLKAILESAYIKVINNYQTNPRYLKLTSSELETRLKAVTESPIGSVKTAITNNFSRTIIITNVSKPNKSVMLLLPKFTTVTFGKDFREAIDLSSFGGDAETWDSPQNLVKNILLDTTGKVNGKKQAFYTQLQNVGHVEVDVISDLDRTIKRGQNSPRLLQALVSTPNRVNALDKLQTKFSEETLQSTTRVKIRKKFSGSKMVFELLIEHGFPVGIPETQEVNLKKAVKELEFSVGKGLTTEIRNNPSILIDLETSKSYKAYLLENLKSLLSTGKTASPYLSEAAFKETAKTTGKKVSLNIKKKTPGNISPIRLSPIRTTQGQFYSLASLQTLLNTHLQDVVSANMGNEGYAGGQRRILNYRTGRFAESVKVERLSQSRAGAITAFYSYMRNPYEVFEPGHKMGTPLTRDPKLLIAKSIREIAATKVANTMRSVRV